MNGKEKRDIIHQVFESAHNFSGIDFLYLMVRVEGMKADWTDNFLEVFAQLKTNPTTVTTSVFYG